MNSQRSAQSPGSAGAPCHVGFRGATVWLLAPLFAALPITAPTQNATSFATIAALRANTTSTGTAIVEGYYFVAGPGGGTFTTAGSSCTDNGGAVIRDGAGHCWYRRMNGPVNAVEFGAYGDLKFVGAGCSIASGSARTLVCPPNTFVAADVGKQVFIANAANAGGTTTLATTIVSFSSGTTVGLSQAATVAVARANMEFGHDDTAAIQRAFNYSARSHKALYIPAGAYLHHGLNFTGAVNLVYGDGYQGSGLNCMDCTDPGSSGSHTSTGVDISGSFNNKFRDITFNGGAAGMGDMAPVVNVLGMRSAGSGVGFAIEHTFTDVSMFTYGPYNLFLYGYEQSDFTNLRAESLGSTTSGNIYLSAQNTPRIVSPYVTAVAAPASMTKVSFSGGRCALAWPKGSGLVLDEGDSASIYSIAIRDCYKIFIAPGSTFLSDTGSSGGFIRYVSIDNTYSEVVSCTTCQEVVLKGTAIGWEVRANQTYTAGSGLTVYPYYFGNGLYDSFISADTTGSSVGMLYAPSCRGSIIDTGQQNSGFGAVQGCRDFTVHSSTKFVTLGYQNSVVAASGTAYPLGLGEAFVKVEASIGELGATCTFLLSAGSHATHVLYGSTGSCGTSDGEHSINAYWNGSDYVIQQVSGSQYTIRYLLTILS